MKLLSHECVLWTCTTEWTRLVHWSLSCSQWYSPEDVWIVCHNHKEEDHDDKLCSSHWADGWSSEWQPHSNKPVKRVMRDARNASFIKSRAIGFCFTPLMAYSTPTARLCMEASCITPRIRTHVPKQHTELDTKCKFEYQKVKAWTIWSWPIECLDKSNVIVNDRARSWLRNWFHSTSALLKKCFMALQVLIHPCDKTFKKVIAVHCLQTTQESFLLFPILNHTIQTLSNSDSSGVQNSQP